MAGYFFVDIPDLPARAARHELAASLVARARATAGGTAGCHAGPGQLDRAYREFVEVLLHGLAQLAQELEQAAGKLRQAAGQYERADADARAGLARALRAGDGGGGDE